MLREVHRRFVWDEQYGRAFEAVRDAVLRKVGRPPVKKATV